MATDVPVFSVTIPAGTTVANSQVTALTLPVARVDGVEVVIPDGPRGEVGWALGTGGVQVIPSQSGTYVVTNDEVVRWPLENFWTSGSWQLFGYNTGQYDHTLQVRFLITRGQGATSQVDPVSSDALGATSSSTGPPQDGGGLPSFPAPPPLPPPPTIPAPALPPPPGLPAPPGSSSPGGVPAASPQGTIRRVTMVVLEAFGQLHIFRVDGNGNLLQSYYSGGWAQATPMTGLLPYSDVGYDMGFDGQLHVFARRTDGTLGHAYYDGKAWASEVVK